MHWLALHFPLLALQAHTRAVSACGPLALIEQGRERRILACNALAHARGVRVGQRVAAALCLVDKLCLLPYRAEKEHRALQGVAVWAGRFSSLVSLAPPRSLLVEAGRSLRLFGGAQGLLRELENELSVLGYQAQWRLGPTPEAALLMAGRGGQTLLQDGPAAQAVLRRVPVSDLPLSSTALISLRDMGLRTLDDLLRLPRAGLAERCGLPVTDYLGRLLGERPDPRVAFQAPPRFARTLELPAETDKVSALLFAARRLIGELCGFLLGRASGASCLQWTLLHSQGVTRLALHLKQASRDVDYLMSLLRERLERLDLAAPVRALTLRVTQMPGLAEPTQALFADAAPSTDDNAVRLLERLQARLGQGAVSGIDLVPDHRPERACVYTAPGQGAASCGKKGRPLWLLNEPCPLRQHRGLPWYAGEPLHLGRERERIETGWWDGAAARDYFVANARDGRRLWVFRELSGERGWFLHGWFV